MYLSTILLSSVCRFFSLPWNECSLCILVEEMQVEEMRFDDEGGDDDFGGESEGGKDKGER